MPASRCADQEIGGRDAAVDLDWPTAASQLAGRLQSGAGIATDSNAPRRAATSWARDSLGVKRMSSKTTRSHTSTRPSATWALNQDASSGKRRSRAHVQTPVSNRAGRSSDGLDLRLGGQRGGPRGWPRPRKGCRRCCSPRRSGERPPPYHFAQRRVDGGAHTLDPQLETCLLEHIQIDINRGARHTHQRSASAPRQAGTVPAGSACRGLRG